MIKFVRYLRWKEEETPGKEGYLKKYFASLLEKLRKRYRMFMRKYHNDGVIRKWTKAGMPYPPPHEFKEELIKDYAAKNGFDTLIETGTGAGKMPWALQDDFAKIYTIELNIDNYLNAKEKFYALENVELIKGESSEQLGILLKSTRFPALFWLDTHESLEKGLTELSIMKEIKEILSSKFKHVILIPDARLFTGSKGYPSLIEIRNFISSLRPTYMFEVENDVIRSYEAS